MVENCVGTIGLPVGLALNFVVNGRSVVIPMAIEEPSVIAAVSGAAKTLASHGGFIASAPERNIIFAQIALLDIVEEEMDRAVKAIHDHKEAIIVIANQHCPNMADRGGGAVDLTVRRVRRRPNPNINHDFKEWLVVHVHVDVCDAMGANCASTVAEGVAPFLAGITGGRVGLRIVSNLNNERLAKASFRIPVSEMSYKSCSGHDVALRIIEAYEWAEVDAFRATTHNKGIMNGVDAVALATGQDWRAIEAAAHAWATRDSKDCRTDFCYRPLTTYWIEEDQEMKAAGRPEKECLSFCGELVLPITVGTKGGVLKTNPVYNYTMGVMDYPDSKQLAMIMVCVGLAQNFAALRALVTEGIQRGHMSLHARNIAIAAGCPSHAVTEVTDFMIENNRISIQAAKDYMETRLLHMSVRRHIVNKTTLVVPAKDQKDGSVKASNFRVEEKEEVMQIECVMN